MLEGTRVIEITTEAGGALAGALLATYGADVVAIEPPPGHALRELMRVDEANPDSSIMFAVLGAGKKSVVLDQSESGFAARVRSLLASADVLIESLPPGAMAAAGLEPAALMEEFPSLVICSLSPYGQDGPRSGWRATPLTAAAAGGQMSMCGDPDKPPLKTAGHQAHAQAGLHAFSAILTAHFAARRSGVGDWLDISMQEVQVSTLEGSGPAALMTGTETGRLAGNRPFAQWGIHDCKDGYIGVAAMPRQTYAIYDAIGHPELKEDPAFVSGWSPEANALLSVLIPEWTSERTDSEIFAHAALFRAPFSMIPGPRQLLEWPGLTATGFWRYVDHPVLGRHPLPGGPLVDKDGGRGSPRPAPLLGQHTAEVLGEGPRSLTLPASPAEVDLPLAGIRVVDMTAVWAGPYGTRFLADMGAEVIKVEGPSFADPVRTMTGARQAPEINQSVYFNEYNRNKLGLSLDIKQPEGMAALKRLIATADVFIENWSSGVAERLGLGFTELCKINPRIISVSMPGFGHTGPDAERVGFGPTIEQMGGLVALQGYEGGPPHRSGISYGDPVAGTVGAGAVAMALLHREKTGQPAYFVVPQRDAICGLIGEFIAAEALGHPLPLRIGNRDATWAPHNLYQAADSEPRPMMRGPDGAALMEFSDRWLAIAIDSDQAWQALKAVIGDPRLEKPDWDTVAGRFAAQDEVDGIIGEWARPRDAEAAAAELQGAGIAADAVLTCLLSCSDEHLLARGAFLPYSHPDAGVGRTTRPPWRMRRRPAMTVNAAPRFGEHSHDVLTRIGGYSNAEVDALVQSNVVTADLIAGAAG